VSQAFFAGASCASVTSCTAVGWSTPTTAGRSQLLAEQWDGSRWAIQPTANPVTPQGALYGVSCASATNCNAVGVYQQGTDGPSLPLAEHWDGTSWTVKRVPLPSLASEGQLEGVTCTAASDCVAVGTYGGNTGLLAEHWNGSRWTVQTLPLPAGTGFSLSSVSCWEPGQCTAVGDAGTPAQGTQALVERENGSSWTIQADAAPGNSILWGVSCPAARSCTAVGENDSVTGMASPTGLAEHWNGTGWTVQRTPVPRKTTTGVILSGVSCAGALSCTAAGSFAPHGMPLVEHEG
jgi:hypothetical protein